MRCDVAISCREVKNSTMYYGWTILVHHIYYSAFLIISLYQEIATPVC